MKLGHIERASRRDETVIYQRDFRHAGLDWLCGRIFFEIPDGKELGSQFDSGCSSRRLGQDVGLS